MTKTLINFNIVIIVIVYLSVLHVTSNEYLRSDVVNAHGYTLFGVMRPLHHIALNQTIGGVLKGI